MKFVIVRLEQCTSVLVSLKLNLLLLHIFRHSLSHQCDSPRHIMARDPTPPPQVAPSSVASAIRAYSLPLILFAGAMYYQLFVIPKSFPLSHYDGNTSCLALDSVSMLMNFAVFFPFNFMWFLCLVDCSSENWEV